MRVAHAFTMSPKFTLPLLFVANLLIPVALLIFATGFFPYKPFIPGRALAEDLEYGNTHEPAPFDKVIFMVVDALRRSASNFRLFLVCRVLRLAVILSTRVLRVSISPKGKWLMILSKADS